MPPEPGRRGTVLPDASVMVWGIGNCWRDAVSVGIPPEYPPGPPLTPINLSANLPTPTAPIVFAKPANIGLLLRNLARSDLLKLPELISLVMPSVVPSSAATSEVSVSSEPPPEVSVSSEPPPEVSISSEPPSFQSSLVQSSLVQSSLVQSI